MRANVWAIAELDSNGSEVRIVRSSPREARAIRHCDRLNRERKDKSLRYVLKGDKIKR